MIVQVAVNFITQINLCGGNTENFVKRERTPQEKIAFLEKAKRSLAYFVMHATFLCSGLTFLFS